MLCKFGYWSSSTRRDFLENGRTCYRPAVALESFNGSYQTARVIKRLYGSEVSSTGSTGMQNSIGCGRQLFQPQ